VYPGFGYTLKLTEKEDGGLVTNINTKERVKLNENFDVNVTTLL